MSEKLTDIRNKNIGILILFVVSLILLLVTGDAGAFDTLRWIMSIFLIALLMRPFANFFKLKTCDGAFSLSFGIGFALTFCLAWFISAGFVVPYGNSVCYISLICLAVFGYLKKYKTVNNRSMLLFKDKKEAVDFFFGFGMFLLFFMVAFYVKGYKPAIDFQTEQYMDYGLMTKIFRSKAVPPKDFWFANAYMNYYYLGQAAAVFLCRIALTTPEYGYNLMLCTVFASMACTTFSLTEGLLCSTGIKKKLCSVAGGVTAMIMTTFGGNGHWLKYGLFDKLMSLINKTDYNYWFPSSTLYIGYQPDFLDKGKHEYPSYTVVLGDLHAHVLNMFFTIPLLAILVDYALSTENTVSDAFDYYCDRNHKLSFAKVIDSVLSPHIIMLAVFLGLYRGVNYWDFPIYFVVSGAVILFCDLRKYGCTLITFLIVLFKGLFILVMGTFLMLPFNNRFEKMISGIKLCKNHSELNQFSLIWFIHVVIALSIIIFFAVKVLKNKNSNIRERFSVLGLLTVAIGLCAIGLIILPEIIYVNDIYGESYARFNTMFKLTYQAFILFGIVAGIAVGVFLNKGKLTAILGCIYFGIALLLGGYIINASTNWFGKTDVILDASLRTGISCVDFIDYDYSELSNVISIINSDERKELIILEEAGDSYSPGNQVSIFTGTSDVVGWGVHERVWRNDSIDVKVRQDDVFYFFSWGDETLCREIVDKYKVNYVYVSPKVLEKYPVNYNGFINLGNIVWQSDDGAKMLIRID